jgi:hypothetical protein
MYCSVKVLAPIATTRAGRACGSPEPKAVQAARAASAASAAATRRRRRRRMPVSSARIRPSSASASAAAATQPTSTAAWLRVWSPLKMKFPRLVAPTGVESVAVPTTHTAAVRSPATITGRASGSSTRQSC